MTAERKKLSLGQVGARGEERSAADRTRAWKVSASRQEALKERARDMRRNPTEAQKALWERLKDKQCGFTFNREVVMGSAIVDFACKTRWLVVEVGDTEGPQATIAEMSAIPRIAEIYRRTLYQPYKVQVARNSSEILGGLDKVDIIVVVLLSLLTTGSAIRSYFWIMRAASSRSAEGPTEATSSQAISLMVAPGAAARSSRSDSTPARRPFSSVA